MKILCSHFFFFSPVAVLCSKLWLTSIHRSKGWICKVSSLVNTFPYDIKSLLV